MCFLGLARENVGLSERCRAGKRSIRRYLALGGCPVPMRSGAQGLSIEPRRTRPAGRSPKGSQTEALPAPGRQKLNGLRDRIRFGVSGNGASGGYAPRDVAPQCDTIAEKRGDEGPRHLDGLGSTKGWKATTGLRLVCRNVKAERPRRIHRSVPRNATHVCREPLREKKPKGASNCNSAETPRCKKRIRLRRKTLRSAGGPQRLKWRACASHQVPVPVGTSRRYQAVVTRYGCGRGKGSEGCGATGNSVV